MKKPAKTTIKKTTTKSSKKAPKAKGNQKVAIVKPTPDSINMLALVSKIESLSNDNLAYLISELIMKGKLEIEDPIADQFIDPLDLDVRPMEIENEGVAIMMDQLNLSDDRDEDDEETIYQVCLGISFVAGDKIVEASSPEMIVFSGASFSPATVNVDQIFFSKESLVRVKCRKSTDEYLGTLQESIIINIFNKMYFADTNIVMVFGEAAIGTKTVVIELVTGEEITFSCQPADAIGDPNLN
jgi:hypothetical protein